MPWIYPPTSSFKNSQGPTHHEDPRKKHIKNKENKLIKICLCSLPIRRITFKVKEEKNPSGTFVCCVQKLESTAPIGHVLQQTESATPLACPNEGPIEAPVLSKVLPPPTDVTNRHCRQVLKMPSPGAGAAFKDLSGYPHHHQCPTPLPWPPWGLSLAPSGSGCWRSGSRGLARSVRSPTPRTGTPAHNTVEAQVC